MSTLLGLLRHVLTTLGGILVARGVIGESEVETLVAAALIIIGALWSALQKRGKAP